jgi:tRNA/rRNA methyltransferase
VHVALVRPELGANVGSIARAMANMGIESDLRIIGSPNVIDDQSRALAKHAGEKLETAKHFVSLTEALSDSFGERTLSLASTARIGSPNRPHPLRVREAALRAGTKLLANEIDEIVMVFGPEGSGLLNEEIAQCDWVVTIPSQAGYRSLNLSQAVLIFCYELNLVFLDRWKPFVSAKPSQKGRLVGHLMELAEQVGFILPGDPYKMKPRLEAILSGLPSHIPDAATLHGLIDQVVRSVKKGSADYKGRFKRRMEDEIAPSRESNKEEYGSER